MNKSDPLLIVPRVAGSLSFASSALIVVYITLRSKQKCTTIYHRVMVGLSCADMVASAAMAVTFLPSPKEVPSIQGPAAIISGSGSTHTCDAQGVLFSFGIFTAFSYNCMLCIYYCLAIAFRLREQKIKKYFEPFLHLIPITLGLYFSIGSLAYNLFNQEPFTPWCDFHALACEAHLKDAWCEVAPNASCVNTSEQCYRGNMKAYIRILNARKIVIRVLIVLIALSFIMCILRVYWTEHQIHELYKIDALIHRNIREIRKAQNSHDNTKVIVVQALAYSVAFGFMLLFIILREILPDNTRRAPVVTFGFFFFLPLQGKFHHLHNTRFGPFSNPTHIVAILCGRLYKDFLIWSSFVAIKYTIIAGRIAL